MTQKPRNCFEFKKKACFVCGSLNHLIKDYNFYENKMVGKSVLNNEGKATGQREVRPDQGIFDSGCSRHKTGNKFYLSDYQDINGGFVAFARSPKRGKIRTVKLDFKDVYFVKELKFNLFSVSQKKNSVLFIETECLILSPDFKLLNESQLLLKVPRQNNMYSFDLKNVVPLGDEIPEILKNFITGIENQIDHKVKAIKCDNGTEFKNWIMNEFCEMKDSKLPTTFWAEAVNTACYVQNRVLVIKPHNKTPYELFLGRKPALSFMRPFRCHVIILNTLDYLGKFDGKSDDGFFMEYSINSKAFRVFNTRTKIVEENMHINFLENKPNVARTGPNWLFDIDTLTMSMNYQPIFARNQTIGHASTKVNINAGQAGKKIVPGPQYVLLPFFTFDEVADDARKKNEVLDPAKEGDMNGQGEAADTNNTNRFNNVSSSVNIVSPTFTTVDPRRKRTQRNEFESMFRQEKDAQGNNTYKIFTPVSAAGSSYDNLGRLISVNAATLLNGDLPTDPPMLELEDTTDLQDTGIFGGAYDDEDVGAESDLNKLETTMNVSPIPTTRIHKDHPKNQIIGDINLATQTRRMTKMFEEHAMRLVGLPKGKYAIGTKWVYRNKKDKKGIEAIRLFLAYASFMGFIVYQMDVKSAFLYGTIEEEVYVCQPPGFEDPQFPNKVYKVEKALYGLHQAPRAWYETLSTYLLQNEFRRGIIDKTLFIKKDKGDILLVQVYVDDIIFRSTKKSLCIEFESLIHKKFQMSSMGELTFFLRLQVIQRNDGIFISQDKYVADILNKFNFSLVKTASTPIETNKALLKDEDAGDVDVLWIQNQTLDFRFNFMNTKIYIDNESTICIVKNPVFHSKTKHIEIRHHFIRDSYEKKLIQVTKIHTDHNVADLLTKAFDVIRELVPVVVPSYHIRGVEAKTRFKAASKPSNDPPLSRVNTLGSGEDNMKLKGIDGTCCLPTATVNTLDNKEQEITATVDGHVKTVTIASVRKYLKLADAGGLSSLPNTENFDQLSLMGYAITSDKLTFQKGHFPLNGGS
ncbi:putative ribonuclease H-like domain-containing protein [Tanacetum coccineum]